VAAVSEPIRPCDLAAKGFAVTDTTLGAGLAADLRIVVVGDILLSCARLALPHQTAELVLQRERERGRERGERRERDMHVCIYMICMYMYMYVCMYECVCTHGQTLTQRH